MICCMRAFNKEDNRFKKVYVIYFGALKYQLKDEGQLLSRSDPERSTRGNRCVPLNGFQFSERPSKDSQGIWHPNPFEKRDTT